VCATSVSGVVERSDARARSALDSVGRPLPLPTHRQGDDVNADDRRFAVLRAIVTDYVATHEPVASRSLVQRHQFGVSSATIRNDMVALEEDGYIAQPHTSAGRVPTDKGYRLFVDRLSEVKPLSAAERRAVQTSWRARSTSTTCCAAACGCSPSSPGTWR
jgi:hypothetical protein